MLKPTPPLLRPLRRLALTTKQVNGGYYKGNRTGTLGEHTKHGGFRMNWDKVRTYVVPKDLAECELTPYVTRLLRKEHGRYGALGPMNGRVFLDRWKSENGQD